MDKNWEKRFMDWVSQRDDDWWEDQQRISIWDIRVVKEFFDIEKVHAVAERTEEIRKRLEMVLLPHVTADGNGNNIIVDGLTLEDLLSSLTPPATGEETPTGHKIVKKGDWYICIRCRSEAAHEAFMKPDPRMDACPATKKGDAKLTSLKAEVEGSIAH